MVFFDSPLKSTTSIDWVKIVTSDFDAFLEDHASCERKAAALAMSFVSKYPDRRVVVEPMVSLAREELEHFMQVFRLIEERGNHYKGQDVKDDYVNHLLSHLRHGKDERFLDRLVLSGVIEARGHERFLLLSKHLEDEKLKLFYSRLSDREAGHYKIFIQMAQQYFSKEEISEAIERITSLEAKILEETPLKPVLH